MGSLPILFVPNKQRAAASPAELPTAFRTIERWANQITLGGIQQITSVDGTVTVTNPTGPTVDLHVATGGGGLYASLTGPGETATPGDLTQAGGFTVNDTAGHGIAMSSQANMTVHASQFWADCYQGPTPRTVILHTGTAAYSFAPFPGIEVRDEASTSPANGGIVVYTTNGLLNLRGAQTTISANTLGTTTSYPLALTSGPGSNAGVFQSQATLNLWTNPGAPNAYSPSTGGGVITPAGSGVSNFCFDVANGHIWVSNAATGVWSMLI